jgi:predicted enzyme related to lactoylglutathione lyase
MLNFNSIIIFSDNPTALVDFYKKVFEKDTDWTGGDFTGFKVGDGYLVFGPHDKVHGKNSNSERIMFNLESDDVMHDFERIKEIGAKVIAEPYHPSEEDDIEGSKLATFEDPDGNYFQVTTPFRM